MALKKASNAGVNPLVAASAATPSPEPADREPASESARARTQRPARTKMLSGRIDPKLHMRMKMTASAEGISMEDALEEAVSDWVAQHAEALEEFIRSMGA